MTLLTICQNIGAEVGVTIPSTIVGNNSQIAKRLLAIANRSGTDLMKKNEWSLLRKEETYTASGSVAEDAITDIFTDGDFDRFVSETDWDRTNTQRLELTTPQEWSLLKGGIATSASNVTKYVQRGSSILFEPALASGTTIAFEYISNKWAQATGGGAYKTSFTVDSDVSVIPERLIELDCIWRIKRSLGRSFADEKADFAAEYNLAVSQDGGRRILSSAGGRYNEEGSRPYRVTP